jgi:hypothetical protein
MTQPSQAAVIQALPSSIFTATGQGGLELDEEFVARDAVRLGRSADRCKRYKLLMESFSVHSGSDFALAWKVTAETDFSLNRESWVPHWW